MTHAGVPEVQDRLRSECLRSRVSGEQYLEVENCPFSGQLGHTVSRTPASLSPLMPTFNSSLQARPALAFLGVGKWEDPLSLDLSSPSFSGDIQWN